MIVLNIQLSAPQPVNVLDIIRIIGNALPGPLSEVDAVVHGITVEEE